MLEFQQRLTKESNEKSAHTLIEFLVESEAEICSFKVTHQHTTEQIMPCFLLLKLYSNDIRFSLQKDLLHYMSSL